VSPWKTVAAGAAALGVLGIAVLIGRRAEPGPGAPKPIGRVALIGDSYAVGLGPELSKLLPDFQYEGRVGIGTAAALPPWLAAFKPDLVLVSLGVNDGASPNLTRYQAIVRELHGIGAKVVWIEPPAGVRNDAVRQVIASLGVATVPATTTPLAADGVHPRSYGSSWAPEIAQVVSHG
jgi:lysophospholipase L1-like esterase